MYVVQHYPHRTTADWCDVGQVTIDILPDDILLCIFYVYVNGPYKREEWRTLVHVCRRWRTLVFGSPHHLNLQLFCSIRTPVLAMLDIWPALPIVVHQHYFRKQKLGNLIAAIKHYDRVCQIDLGTFFDIWQLERIVSVMQEPFPVLTFLSLTSGLLDGTIDGANLIIPNSFLGGSAPRLEHLHLNDIPFPGLPKLVSSATDLVYLELRNIPYNGYISPDVMVTCLSALTSLKTLIVEFAPRRYPFPRESRYPPSSTRIILPALTRLKLKATNKYVQDVMTRIDTPLLDNLHLTFLEQAVFDTPHLSQLISRTANFRVLDEARVTFSEDEVVVALPSPTRNFQYVLALGISSDDESVQQLSSFVQVCLSSFPGLARVERFYICWDGHLQRKRWGDNIPDSHRVELLHLFTAAKELYLSEELVRCLALTLRRLVKEGTTEVSPALQNPFLHDYRPWCPIGQAIDDFIATRQLSGHPIFIGSWPLY
jgi:F-box-like